MSGMQRQAVNFIAERTPRWYGWGGLLLVALLAADAIHTYMQGTRSAAAITAARVPVVRPATVVAPAEQRRRQAVLEDAQRLATRLATPWDGLFNAVERAGGDGVQVQSIRPNAGSRQIVIAAEARELTAMLNFLTRLTREPVLARPYIQAQEERAGSAGFPLQFVIVAEWRQEPAK